MIANTAARARACVCVHVVLNERVRMCARACVGAYNHAVHVCVCVCVCVCVSV